VQLVSLMGGLRATVISKLLGHSSVAVTPLPRSPD
jgi:hypothetical protein